MFKALKNISHNQHKAIKSKLILANKRLDQQPVLQMVLLAFLLNLILEIFSRCSIFKGFASILNNPLMFIYNVLIILLSLCVANFFPRKKFMVLLISIAWLSLGVMNFILLGYRVTPLTGNDFNLIFSVFEIVYIYFNLFQGIIILLLTISVIIVGIFAFRSLPRNKVQLKNAFFNICCVIVLILGVSNLSIHANILTNDFSNIPAAYKNYGFVYCFTTSVIAKGIDEPPTYSPETVAVVLEEIEQKDELSSAGLANSKDDLSPEKSLPSSIDENTGKDDPASDHLTMDDKDQPPNIIMIQLESFFDVRHLVNFSFVSDPTPNFNKLKSEYSTGFLSVPVIGGGTANTEFEVLTGMNLDFFGAGEYPYKTILKEKTIESICYDLDELGYHSHAIHNNTGTFYSRNTVYPNLGFDSFSSIEYMQDIEYNSIGWAKDHVLISEIMNAMTVTTEKDFIYTVTVQTHGKYPDGQIDDDQMITLTGDLEESDISQYEYFADQLHETDAFVGELLEQLQHYPEPVVVVLYGDHLPALVIEDEDLDNGNKFQTEYVLWSNYPMENITQDLSAYQLSSYVMERLEINKGILNKFHQNNEDEPDYQDQLLLLQYDMLYGDMAVYGGVNPYIRKNMTMGYDEIQLSDVTERGETIFITGNNFTKWSEVYLEGALVNTLYVDRNTLIIPDKSLSDIQSLFVGQVSDSGKLLSQSDDWFEPITTTK